MVSCNFFILKHRLSCYPFCTPDHFGWHRCQVLYSPKTLPATPWRCSGSRSAPNTTCSRIENKTPGFNAQGNQCVGSRRRWQVESNDGQFHLFLTSLYDWNWWSFFVSSFSHFLLSRSSSNVRSESSNKTRQIKLRIWTSLITLHRQPELRNSFPESATLYL